MLRLYQENLIRILLDHKLIKQIKDNKFFICIMRITKGIGLILINGLFKKYL
jgi:hypothetical protein